MIAARLAVNQEVTTTADPQSDFPFDPLGKSAISKSSRTNCFGMVE